MEEKAGRLIIKRIRGQRDSAFQDLGRSLRIELIRKTINANISALTFTLSRSYLSLLTSNLGHL